VAFRPSYPARRKVILDPRDLVEQLASERRAGRIVVTANGCFDLLHVGHIRYLHAARELGDILVVGVNTDASMRMIKPDRPPVTPDYERMELIAGLEPVTYVVPLHDRTPEQLLRLLRPDIHTKGTDYTLEQIPERLILYEYGGRVELVGDRKEHSSTAIREAVRRPAPADGQSPDPGQLS
jgi:D-beta-D-heptose 7-phosphate kinase/D-beta-D-heptose 1-phosphate adenosyltransferase